jgi:hypothetical protein
MSGAVGESASRDMQAYIDYADQLPTWEAVMKDPKNAKVPESAGAFAIVVLIRLCSIKEQAILDNIACLCAVCLPR